MSYKLSKLPYGTAKIVLVSDIVGDLEITEIRYIKGFGFLFLLPSHYCIGRIDDKGKIKIPWVGRLNECGEQDGTLAKFNHPSSICYSKKQNICYVVEKGGSSIRRIELSNGYTGTLFGSTVSKKVESFFVNVKDIDKLKTACDIDNKGNIYWVIDGLNRCFKYIREMSDIECYIGDGHRGFSVASNLYKCRLNGPEGIIIDKETIYISDTENHCIRKVEGGIINVIAGIPCMEVIYPSKIAVSGNTVYFVDENEIKYMVNNEIGIAYTSDRIISMDVDDKKNLFILEKA